jgi:hypothetical protein
MAAPPAFQAGFSGVAAKAKPCRTPCCRPGLPGARRETETPPVSRSGLRPPADRYVPWSRDKSTASGLPRDPSKHLKTMVII